jgi:beta-glucanase (GH16 family)
MSSGKFVIAALLAGVLPAWVFADDRQRSSSSGDYQLVWTDEFDVDGPSRPGNWVHEHGFVRNDELQWYQPANARCVGGLLVIEARRERVSNPGFDPTSSDWRRSRPHADYTSASIQTRGKHRWLYGRFEMRAKLDVCPGLWPAFWTLGEARSWPGCGEIDVMEYYDGKLLANAAWLGDRRHQPAWDSTEHPLASFNDPAWADKFHDWRMDWDRDHIRLYVDNQLLNEIDVAAAIDNNGERAQPFREPHYILLNLAVGGTRGGDPSATEFPARFEVDYVRVYQRPDQEHRDAPQKMSNAE